METKSEIEAFTAYLKSRIAPGWHVIHSDMENSSSNPLTLIAEPYGAHVTILAGDKCKIVAEAPDADGISITFSDRYVQIWMSGLFEIFEDGVGYGTTGDFLEWRREWQEAAG